MKGDLSLITKVDTLYNKNEGMGNNNDDLISKVRSKLETNDKGRIENTYYNIQYVFLHDSNLQGLFRENDFTFMKEINNKPPWRRSTDTNILWTDADDAQLFIYFGLNYEITNTKRISEVLVQQFYKNSYNPIKEYLNKLKWDGTERLERLFIDYLGASDTAYVRTVTKISLLACVYRVMEAPYKHDTTLVLVGNQGIGKSFILSKLGMDYFNESVNTIKGDEVFMKISSSWIVELGELTALKGASSEQVKSFLSATEDTFRPKYSKYAKKHPRRCVFFGTTNEMEFLKDETGNRRFYPVKLGEITASKNVFEDFTQCEVDQVWAEAVECFKRGDITYLVDEGLKEMAKEFQNIHKVDSGLEGKIEQFIKLPITKDWYERGISERIRYFENNEYLNESMKINLIARTKICPLEIWEECLGERKTMTNSSSSRIKGVLNRLPNLEPIRTTFGTLGQQRGFRIINQEEK